MKLVKYIMTVAAVLVLTLNFAKADSFNTSKESDLSYQLKNEIKSTMLLPVYLKYTDDNLKGEATVYVTVKNNGKLCLTKVEGANDQLNALVTSKVNSINAWTSNEFAGKVFKYKIVMN